MNDLYRNDDDENDLTVGVPSFHLWRDYGAGFAFEQASPLIPTEMGDDRADLTPVLSSVVIDETSTVWWNGGANGQGLWKSRRAID